jgi:SAM-dependent methyltransferase
MPCCDLALYDDFAWFYNRYWNEEFHGLAFPILERIWLSRLPAKARVLDVCCGTGYLAGLLTARGMRVTGIDVSEGMIAQARENVPAAEFHVAKASEFKLLGRFDGAVSTFDSLNHILNVEELEECFGRVAKALKPGSPFAFDVLLESAYHTNWADAFSIVRDDHALLIAGSNFDVGTQLASCRVTMFRLIDGQWRRSDADVVERCYTTPEIDQALAKAGFIETACYDARDLGMRGQLGQGRTFVVSTRE